MHGWLAKMRGTLVGNEKLRSEGMREMRQAKANRKHRKQNKSQGKSSAKGGEVLEMSLEEGTEVVAGVAQPYDSITVAAIAWWDKSLEEVQEFNREAQELRLGQGQAGERQLPVSIAAQHHEGPVGVDRMCYRCFWTLLDVNNYSPAYSLLFTVELFPTDCAGAEHILAGPNMPDEYQTIPATIIWFHYISLLTSISIVVMSIFDYGTLSLYMNPLVGLLTIFFHASLIILTHKRPELKGMLSVEAVVFAYLLSLSWLACFVVMVYVAWKSQGRSPQLFGMDEAFLTAIDNATQRLQFMCTSLEFGLLGDLAVRSTWARRSEFEDCAGKDYDHYSVRY
ncbi:hypothetical protein F5877DRAFT_64573 [Lentinula edodes]|nr:hypothetical protein F5877DRAFT_64573 [Lentinula edodes]